MKEININIPFTSHIVGALSSPKCGKKSVTTVQTAQLSSSMIIMDLSYASDFRTMYLVRCIICTPSRPDHEVDEIAGKNSELCSTYS